MKKVRHSAQLEDPGICTLLFWPPRSDLMHRFDLLYGCRSDVQKMPDTVFSTLTVGGRLNLFCHWTTLDNQIVLMKKDNYFKKNNTHKISRFRDQKSPREEQTSRPFAAKDQIL